ncbi:hypothetical protein NP233_g12220 [Leucocoprinus birnbaumii]|uniref:Uncharacterized protein n=1 Tax=Leucocoprinus birnbaumii TaxID=56174 RepID=A0AAD5YN92_9AGAR|nr:hypothetical protein NP233_g12220 [Leucocoprinus birnbaumii]
MTPATEEIATSKPTRVRMKPALTWVSSKQQPRARYSSNNVATNSGSMTKKAKPGAKQRDPAVSNQAQSSAQRCHDGKSAARSTPIWR